MTLNSVSGVNGVYGYPANTQEAGAQSAPGSYQTTAPNFEDQLHLSQEALDLYQASGIKNEIPPQKEVASVEVEVMKDSAKNGG